MDQHVTIEDIALATRARARMRQQVEQEVLADTLTPERYAQLYTELQEKIKDLLLPSWWWGMEWKAYQMTATFFDSMVHTTRETLKKRGVTTDDMIDSEVRERVGVLY